MNLTSYRLDTPCGYEIWIIPLASTVRFRVFFGHEEVGLAALNEKLSIQGLKMLGEKIAEVCKK